MAIYAMGDFHLSESVPKPMDVFGGVWRGYRQKIIDGLEAVGLKDEDVLVVAGDFSWGISLKESLADFRFLDTYPGKKLLLKGNHDLWWQTVRKMKGFFAENGIKTIDFLHNNCYIYEGIGLCGTRGWFFEEERGDAHDRKMLSREMIRLEKSLSDAQKAGAERLYAFLHYPPMYGSYRCDEMIDILRRYRVKRCYYGHLHGGAHALARQGVYDGVDYRLIAADYLHFLPVRVD